MNVLDRIVGFLRETGRAVLLAPMPRPESVEPAAQPPQPVSASEQSVPHPASPASSAASEEAGAPASVEPEDAVEIPVSASQPEAPAEPAAESSKPRSAGTEEDEEAEEKLEYDWDEWDEAINLASHMGDIVPLNLEIDPQGQPGAGGEDSRAHETPDPGEEPQPVAPTVELPPFKQKRVCVSLLKGGVGKTTITCFVATAIQKMWKENGTSARLLVVDCDPQGSATDFFLPGEEVPPERSLRALFPPCRFPDRSALIWDTRYPSIDILPAHTSVADVAQSPEENLDECLAWYLDSAADDYSLVLIDTPPSNTLALRNALTASSGIFMPMDPSRQALKTLAQFSHTVKRYASRNHELKVCGVVFSRYDKRNKLDCAMLEHVTKLLKREGRLPPFVVPRRACVSSSYNDYQGFEGLDPKYDDAAVIKVFRDMAEQVLSK